MISTRGDVRGYILGHCALGVGGCVGETVKSIVFERVWSLVVPVSWIKDIVYGSVWDMVEEVAR